MSPVYRLDYSKDFIEVFDTTNMVTVYATENNTQGKKKAVATITKLRGGIITPEGLNQYD